MINCNKYDDIIHLKRHESRRRARMPQSNRAAQFAPFAALTGYDAVLSEAMRETYERLSCSADMQEELNAQLAKLIAAIKEHPTVELTYFVADTKKEGGAFITTVGQLKYYNECEHTLTLADNKKIHIEDIIVASG